eukprot:CAMPEP_0113899714 /NCGR_PEP_ID=MMETSP0780_2-20120614/20216_1 /TAXON_ID=652834 /ORGANISM="Palpitomonas bilix" /LENGTH=59 /DNA_ID=CAMNT_0000891975 /DNA_START=132 /DNA_END=308 /DNA_ORIENTATION=+ /assembly_acc=CAM_ASM_000599
MSLAQVEVQGEPLQPALHSHGGVPVASQSKAQSRSRSSSTSSSSSSDPRPAPVQPPKTF